VSSVAEERRFNPRLGQGKSAEDFVRIMRELALPYPHKMDVAVPGNLQCGLPRAAPAAPAALERGWAPIALSAAGGPELDGAGLHQHQAEVLVLDVREPDEFGGELGHVAGAELVPLHVVGAAAAVLPRERPIVTVCRSGGRSGKAALELLGSGLGRVASLAAAWRAGARAGGPSNMVGKRTLAKSAGIAAPGGVPLFTRLGNSILFARPSSCVLA
jgi:rhodanese-related sulfurtransferase